MWIFTDISMETLFGGHCSATGFRHDEEMRERHRYREVSVIFV